VAPEPPPLACSLVDSGASRTGLVPLTCAQDGRAHLVTDEDFAHGVKERGGMYAALCGRTVMVCSMWTSGALCPRCGELSAERRRRAAQPQTAPWWKRGIRAQKRHPA